MRCCLTPNCPNIVRRGRCDACQTRYESRRGSRHKRGYDNDWLTVRARFLDESYPWWCGIQGPTCQAPGRMMDRQEIEVDHIQKFSGMDDPLRLDTHNLRVTCSACHRARHGSEAGGPVEDRDECPVEPEMGFRWAAAISKVFQTA